MQKIIDIARIEVGTTEMPANSNCVKYNDWLYGKPVRGINYPWCGAFVSWVFYHAGFPLGTIDYLRGFAGCPYAVANIHKWGSFVPKQFVKPGDVVFFDWDGNSRWDHTGIFIRWLDFEKGIFETIEGNTAIGNDSNGGTVMIRKRMYSHGMVLFVHPNVLKGKEILA